MRAASKFALAANLGYYTDDPDTMPFISYAIPQASYLAGGGHYIRGGSQVLSDRLVAIAGSVPKKSSIMRLTGVGPDMAL